MDTNTALAVAKYDAHADKFAERALTLCMQPQLEEFSRLTTPGALVLDAGCGSGKDFGPLGLCGFRAIGVDLSRGLLAHAGEVPGALLARADIGRLPFPDAAFDGVWACSSLVHFDMLGAGRVLRELRRALKPWGSLYASVKFGDDTGEWTDSEVVGRRWFQLWQLPSFAACARAAGFEVISSGLDKGRWVDLFAVKA
jgi:SAM-dependent methyltransferase